MSKISRVRFRNVYGITEQVLEPGDVTILRGPNESGKTSFLDSIATALSNKGARTRIVKNGEKEAEMIIDLDDGITIDRKTRLESSDFIKVSRGKEVIGSPESFLRSLFSAEQFNPVRDFCDKTPREQKKVLLSLCSIEYGRDDFVRDFGELPPNYEEGRHVLENLEAIQSINGKYYQQREATNRERRQLEAIRDDVLGTLPHGYKAEEWREVVLSDLFKKVTDATALNEAIERANERIGNASDIEQSINNQYDLQVKEAEEFKSFRLNNAAKHKEEEAAEINATIEAHTKKIAELEDLIRKIKASIAGEQSKLSNLSVNLKAIHEGIEGETVEKIAGINEARRLKLEAAAEKVKNAEAYLAEHKPVDVAPLQAEAANAEAMKNYLRESDRVTGYNAEILVLKQGSEELTRKIELARELPGILLQKADMPIPGISIRDGELAIDDLPVDNLSDGRRMEVALEVAKAKAGDLKVILVDKFESLDPKRQASFIEKAKATGLQFFITAVSDGDGLEILEL